jgi:hypothetical protein
LLREFNAKVDREDLFKPTIGNENICEMVKLMELEYQTLPHSKFPLSEVQCFLIVTFIDLLGHVSMQRLTVKLTMF